MLDFTAPQIIINPDNHPLFIHCNNGTINTGLVIVCLRILQMWSLSAAINEYFRFLKTPEFTDEDEEFFEGLREDIIIPPLIPHFLWGTPLPPSPSMSPRDRHRAPVVPMGEMSPLK
ncbi:protein-tyrosine-phosphatase [Dispira simplex]|nr:protein-tyrosine-phosphatase [Dispira simplex]